MDTIDEQLMPRALIVAHLASKHLGNKYEWWGDYDKNQGLVVTDSGDDFVEYRRKDGSSPTMRFENIQPQKIQGVVESKSVRLGAKPQDAASITSYNAGGLTSRPWSYTGEFEESTLVTRREAFELSFEESLKATYSYGGEATLNKFALEATVTSGQTSTTEDEDAKGTRHARAFSFSGETPPGVDERITATRDVVRLRTTLTGYGDYEHSIIIGKHWHGSWQGGRGKWASLADFLRVVKGEAPLNYDMSEEFRQRQAPRWAVKSLETPLNLPFTQVLEYDEGTDIKLRPESI